MTIPVWTNCGGVGASGSGDFSSSGTSSGSSTGGERNPVCTAGVSDGEVQQPVWVANLSGQTSWFASPVLADLDDDGENELIAAYCSLYAGYPRRRPDPSADGDGQLEIMVQTFDHGMDIFSVPGSGCDCLLWTTARAGPLRMGQPNDID